MLLHEPFRISSRLLPALYVGGACIQLTYSVRPGHEGRTRYEWTIDIEAGEFTGDDLQSGCQGGSLQEGFESLLSFLSAAGESYGYALRTGRGPGENADLFPAPVVEWAYGCSDELSMLACELEEAEGDLIEE